MRRIYLDYAATTPLDAKVLAAMKPFFQEKFGNPSSVHQFGREAQIALDEARAKVASFFACQPEEIYFTGSATESNNWLISGLLRVIERLSNGAIEDLHVVTTAIEHKSVLEPLKALEKKGLQTSYVRPGKDGIVKVQDIKKALRSNTVLVSVIYVNNETGAIQPIKDIGKLVEKERKARDNLPIYFHTDAVQAIQFLESRPSWLKLDLLTFSGHKIYGPKGVGGLYIRQGLRIEPLIYGGGQEYGLRSGTENVASIVGLAQAIEQIAQDKDKIVKKLKSLQKRLLFSIIKIPGCKLNSPEDLCVPHILNVSFKGIDAETLIIALDQRGIAVSSGSACTAGLVEPSYVLLAMGRSKNEARQAIRISLGKKTTSEEIKHFSEALKKTVKNLRQ